MERRRPFYDAHVAATTDTVSAPSFSTRGFVDAIFDGNDRGNQAARISWEMEAEREG